jgi:hypothetical protein
VMPSVTNAVSHGIANINGDFRIVPDAESGAICDITIKIAAPLKKPTTTEYGINFINLPPPLAPIMIWKTPVRTTNAVKAARILPCVPRLPTISAKALLNKTSIGGVGELTKPRVPPEIPEAIESAIAPKMPAIAPTAAEIPCGVRSTTPNAIDCGKSIVEAANPPKMSEKGILFLSLPVKSCIIRVLF